MPLMPLSVADTMKALSGALMSVNCQPPHVEGLTLISISTRTAVAEYYL